MNGGKQISPLVAGLIVVVVVAVAGLVLMKLTGAQGKVKMTDAQVQEMNKLMGQRPGSVGMGGKAQPSMPPGMKPQ